MLLDHKVLIGGICKNVGGTIEKTLQKMIETGALFPQYEIVIYENNSTDETKSILNEYRANYGFNIITEDNSIEELTIQTEPQLRTFNNALCRISLIALARNKLLKEIFKSRYKEYDFAILIDLDLFEWDLDGIIDSFNYTNWDCISANGIKYNGSYWDAYAYRDQQYPFGPELLDDYWWTTVCPRIQRIIEPHDLLPVYSAFGGLAIYKMASIKACTYSAVLTPHFHKLMKMIIKTQTCDGEYTPVMEVLKQESLVGAIQGIEKEGIFYTNNSGYEYPIVCEHVNFHAQMIDRGFNNIYINPKMIVNYPDE